MVRKWQGNKIETKKDSNLKKKEKHTFFFLIGRKIRKAYIWDEGTESMDSKSAGQWKTLKKKKSKQAAGARDNGHVWLYSKLLYRFNILYYILYYKATRT